VNLPVVNMVTNRLSLRQPQRESLELLSEACDLIGLEKGSNVAASLAAIRSKYPQVEEFERDFPSLCFALATGVGKTRLMGAFISYLYKAEGIRHFFVLAPNLTIYNKLIADFTPNTPKYVFQGISDFATNPPEIITGDTYEDGRGVRGDIGVPLRQGRLFDPGAAGPIHVNIFNVSKINSEVRGDKQPRIKRLHEYIGESYFEYLSKLDDLVLLMDESHRYRASAGVKAINELKPIPGLEFTATPQVESGSKGAMPFKNVIYSYPLSAALRDGFVKEPAVATRENFDASAYDQDGLERLKLEDGVRVHEEAKAQLVVYAREYSQRRVKPFMLVVAKDTQHANALVKLMEDEAFFQGQYKGKVITVHSQTKGEEKDEIVQQLLTVEDPNNPVEIVVHVNMLKEGWDVTNLYTIVPLRAANSRTLVEQSIGRGLRLPYGKRTGVAAVDRLTIISHDKFQEIIDHANDPNSIIRVGVVIGRDIPDTKSKVVVIESNFAQQLGIQSLGVGGAAAKQAQPTLFAKPEEQRAAQVTYQVLKQFERLPSSADLRKPEVQQKIIEQVQAAIAAQGGSQQEFEQFKENVDLAAVVKKTVDLHIDLSIDIPRIVVVPTGEVTSGFMDFDLDVSNIHLQPVKQRVLIQHLGDGQQYTLESGASVALEEKLEDYIVRGLIDYPDINYDEHAELLYKLAGQAVTHLKSYLKDEGDVLNVLLVHQKLLVQHIYAQMEANYVEKATAYEVHVSKGFTTMRPVNGTAADEEVRDYRTPVDQKKNIRTMLFGGFKKCLYAVQKFDSDTERRLASTFEKDQSVLKWCKPPRDALKIDYAKGEVYEPDFVVETETCKYICESKGSDEMHAAGVEAKARAAATWCEHASKHGGGKPWKYLLIPHEQIDDAKTLAGLAAMYEVIG
jgi:type III restriction enzyme